MAATSFFLAFSLYSILACTAHGQLSANFYASSCPNVETVVQSAMASAVNRETRMAASILRLHFHDCFVNGCDGSILLDDTATFTGEKNAAPNKNSTRGFEVIDAIKARVEAACSSTVSCADILALAARDGVVLTGGPTWTVQLGRRDATTASKNDASNNLLPPTLNLEKLTSAFTTKGISAHDLTSLYDAHTIGQARCINFRSHMYREANIDFQFATLLQYNCPLNRGGNNHTQLDFQTPNC